MKEILVFIFSFWFLITIFWQFDILREKLKFLYKLNFLNAIPIWTFFAPTPGITDTHVVFRDKATTGELSEWREINLVESRHWYHFLWNPHKRKSKLVVDALSQIKNLRNKSVEQKLNEDEFQYRIQLSKGYLILLNLVMNNEKLNKSTISRQFIVVDSYLFTGTRQPLPIFSSPFHRFE